MEEELEQSMEEEVEQSMEEEVQLDGPRIARKGWGNNRAQVGG
jgi:hypothetical protein